MESLEYVALKLSLQRRRPRTFFPFLLIFVFLQFHPCLPGDTISTGHSITGNEKITSEGGIFQLGYLSLGSPARYYIGIWYKQVTTDNVVWVANRDTPLPDKTAELKISADGSNLVLLTKFGSLIWSTNSTPTSSSHSARAAAVLLDSGNLVLRDGNSSGATMWESFDHPTDTLLPGGRLGWNSVTKRYIAITSWKSEDDPSSGLYSQRINPNGVLELPLYWNNTHAYWTTGVWNGEFFTGIPEMRAVIIYYSSNFTKDNNGSYYTYWLRGNFTTKIKVEVNGQIKQANWDESTGKWNVFWSRPADQCDVYGLCGAFGVCSEQPDQNICGCLDGFEPASAQDWESNGWTGGCMRKNKLQCEGDDFFPASVKSAANLSAGLTIGGGAESCRSACLGDCSCTAYSYEYDKCSTWKGDLLNLVQATGDGSAARILVRIATSSGKSGGGRKLSQSVIIGIAVAAAMLVILLAAAGTARYSWKSNARKAGARKQGHASAMFGEARKENGGPELPFYRLRDIMVATNNFSETNKLGQGGFGPVYRGELRGGQEVAIKTLSRSSKQGLDEFTNEVKLIAKLQHVNLVQLLGCCAEREERILIYEYMPNKSLDQFIFDPILGKRLDWEKRLEILAGIARGLQYLHQESRLKVIHRDLKTSNILLDAAMNPKISDFGLARIFGDEQSHISTNRVAGTCGYMPPEYAMEGRYSTKSDVFSFGVIVLEIVSGLKMTSFRNEEYSLNLLGHAWKLWNEDKVPELFDPSLEMPKKYDQVLKSVKVGLLCVQEDAGERPTMSSIVHMLSNDSENLVSPKKPAYSHKTRSPDGGTSPIENELGNCSTNDITISVLQPR